MGHESRADRDRFEALHAAEGRRVLAYALRRTDQPADAADVVAEVFLVAWRRLPMVPEGDEARLWLYGVSRRVLANHRRGALRRQRLGRRLATVLSELMVDDPAESAGDVEPARARVRAALGGLSDTDREVITLTTWEGLTAPQVAAVLGIPAATVRSRLHRARGRLRAALADQGRTDAGPTDDPPTGAAAAGEHPGPDGHGGGDERPLVRDHEEQR